MAPKIRNIIIFVVIVAILVLIYIFFIKPSPDQSNLVSSPSTTTLPNVNGTPADAGTTNTTLLGTQDFLTLLLNVKNIKLDDAIFTDPAFNSLHDSSIVLVPDTTTGRPNPFAQFGNDVTPPAPATNIPTAPVVTSPAQTIPTVIPPVPTTPTTGAPKAPAITLPIKP
jgi:hypothetical protein